MEHGGQRGPLVSGNVEHFDSAQPLLSAPGVTSQGVDVPLVGDGGHVAPLLGHSGHLCPPASGEVVGVESVEEAAGLAVAANTPDESSSGDLQSMVRSGVARQGEAGAGTPGGEERVEHLNDVGGTLRENVGE